MKNFSTKSKKRKRKRIICINLICWLIIPITIIVMLVLDGLGIYLFNTERLIVIGACLLVILIPFFNEITIKNISLKKDNNSK